MPLPLGDVLYESGGRLGYVFFPTTSIISMLYVMEDGSSAEIAIVGNEGMLGVSLFMGGETTPSRAPISASAFKPFRRFSAEGAKPVAKTDRDERIELTTLDAGFYRLVLRYGFMQGPNIPSELATCGELGLNLDLDKIHYFIGHVDLLAGRKQHGMVAWRDRLFTRMASNTEDATASYQIPIAQVMKVGLQVGI